MWNLLLRALRYSPAAPQRPGGQPTRPVPKLPTPARRVSDRELAKGVLPRGRPRIWKPGTGTPLPKKPGIYGHINPKTDQPHRFGSTFQTNRRVRSYRANRKLGKMPVRIQIARDGVTPEQLFAAEKLKIKKHKTLGKGNIYAGGNGNIPKQFRQPKPMQWRAS